MKALIGAIIGLFVGGGIYFVWHTVEGGLVAVLVAGVIAISIAKSK